jgi:hypothetical protein
MSRIVIPQPDNFVGVWCDFSERPTLTFDGFCNDCGATDHKPLEA